MVTAFHEYTAGAKTKGYIKDTDTNEIKKFMFNPETLEYARSSTFSEISSPGMSMPLAQYVKGNATSFVVPLYIYDKPNSGEVEAWETFLENFLSPLQNSMTYTKPHGILFAMGSFIRSGVVESVNFKHLSFDSDLNPTESEITLTIRWV